MSLKAIDRHKSMIHIAGREYFVRYSLNALLCLEVMYKPLSEILQTPFAQWTTEDVLQLTRAAMCSLPENRKAVDNREFEAVEPSLSELGELIQPQDLPLLRVELMTAIIDAMPSPNQEEPTETPPVPATRPAAALRAALFPPPAGRD